MATKVLDITKEHCPMTFVKTKIELSKLQPGDILEVLLAEGEPLDNVPRNAKEQGYNVLSVEHVEGTTHINTLSISASVQPYSLVVPEISTGTLYHLRPSAQASSNTGT